MKELLSEADALAEQIASLKEKHDSLKKQISETVMEMAESQLAEKDYGCGTATIDIDGYKVKATVSKKVTWDQDMLSGIYDRIKSSNEDPTDYIKTKFTVPENSFKAWPEVIKSQFVDARIVEPSKPVITWEQNDEDN